MIATLPLELRKSITWDRGIEMAQHARFKTETGVPIYFCDPQAPWQRGTNENTNGLLRQYWPKGADLRQLTADRVRRTSPCSSTPDHARPWNGRLPARPSTRGSLQQPFESATWPLSVVAGRIEHMIETLAGPGAGEVEDLTARDLLVDRAGSQGGRGPRSSRSAGRWLPGGPTCTRRSRSTTRLRSPSRAVSTRSPSLVRVRHWSRSSASPSSAPSSGSRRPRRRSSSATPSSCATDSRGCGRRSRPDGSRHGGPAWSRRSPSTPTPSLTVEAAAFVDAQVAAVAGRVGAGAAGPARRRDDQALRPRRRRPGRGSGGRLPPRRPAPRHDPRRRRPLRRHDAARGRARHRRRPRPRPGTRPRRRSR